MIEVTNKGIFYFIDNVIKAKVTYFLEKDVLVVDHTYVDETLRGQGIASILSQKLVEYAINNHYKIHPTCWYIKKWMNDHPQYQYLLKEAVD